MKSKFLVSIADLDTDDIVGLVEYAVKMKKGEVTPRFDGKVLALLFEKPSLRTKVSFDIAMYQLGGHAIYMGEKEVGIGDREPIYDVAKVLSRYVDVIAARTYSHETVKDFAHYSDIPVINALSDLEHPCQALSDLLTISEKKGALDGINLAYIGDGNNVANSLLLTASLVGMNIRIASPKGYAVNAEIEYEARVFAGTNGSQILVTDDPEAAADGADVIYTDVWTSMGQESEARERIAVFAPYQVNRRLLSFAKADAIIMHDLPAHHGQEVAAGILYSDSSVVFDQAENRLHMQKAILAKLLV